MQGDLPASPKIIRLMSIMKNKLIGFVLFQTISFAALASESPNQTTKDLKEVSQSQVSLISGAHQIASGVTGLSIGAKLAFAVDGYFSLATFGSYDPVEGGSLTFGVGPQVKPPGFGNLSVMVAPGIEFAEYIPGDRSSYLNLRTAVAYPFELGSPGKKWSVGPDVSVDFNHARTEEVFGIAASFGI